MEPKTSANDPTTSPNDTSTFLVLAASLASSDAWAVAAVAIKLTGLPEFVAVIVRRLEEDALLEALDELGVVDVADVLDGIAIEVEGEEVESVVDVAWFA